ncbi:MAG: hypothetical protein JSS66_05075 [Armatimonadetes bacterium]|nr:hypothetical protein [Armatimonadota bacterium]
MPEYEPITRVRVIARIKDLDGSLADPTQLVFTIKEPDGNETSLTWGIDDDIVQDSEGEFHIDWDADQAGLHRYRWQANGAVQVAFGGAFNIKEPDF